MELSPYCMIPIVVIAVLVGAGLKGWHEELQHEKRYREQTTDRWRIIRKLYADQSAEANWEHITLVINQAGFKNRKGRKFTNIMIKKEHARMTIKDLDIKQVKQQEGNTRKGKQ